VEQYRGTTILSVRRGNQVVIGGDGQVTMGNVVMKGNARKVRRLYKDRVLAGFAGGTADAFTLFERFEAKLETYGGQLNGDVIEPEHGLIAIGSGGDYAKAAATALLEHSDLDAEAIVRHGLETAANICIYTNNNLIVEKLDI